CPKVEGIGFTIPDPVGGKSVDWAARLDNYAQSVDQRVKLPGWLQEFENRGGKLRVKSATVEDLEECARTHDLGVVATGQGAIGNVFTRNPELSPYDKPQRVLALTYVRGMKPQEGFNAVAFSLIPNVGEYFVFPALTTTGPCDIMVFEALPGGPMDRWSDVTSPAQHLERSKWILTNFLPWEAARCSDVELTDENGTLTGRVTPGVRNPVGTLPSGKHVLGMADALVLNDPITGQGANNAARSAEIYLESIIERGDRPADPEWMQQVFDRYWTGYGKWATEWTNLMLHPPAHVVRLLDCAGKITAVAGAVANGFDDPRSLFPWFMDAGEAEKFVQQAAQTVASRFDKRDYRRALGQFATGVTVVTARGRNGNRIGMTVNSFSSVSLEPPLILWSIAKNAASYADFMTATHFAVNVLEAKQHHLSRQFSTPMEDKFAGVEFREGPGGIALLEGVTAHFVCRKVRQYDGGDHIIFLGEVEQYEYHEGEPLVFHSGRYRIATRHPDVAE
ncbi:MAG: flavin reductase, partial [Acidobacteria bacterium]|nr:flavin reductase [Acidobacteriota bacterium]